jgi:hypothetical protein
LKTGCLEEYPDLIGMKRQRVDRKAQCGSTYFELFTKYAYYYCGQTKEDETGRE